MFNIHWIRICGLFLSFLILGLTACQQVPRMETPTPTPQNASTDPGSSGLMGKIFAESDVSGQPDVPLPEQMILAIPVDAAEDLLGVPAGQLSDRDLRFMRADLPQTDPRMTATLSDSDGYYELPLEPGDYILCVADSEETPPDFPAHTRGCGRAQVYPGRMSMVNISSGFGEILLLEE